MNFLERRFKKFLNEEVSSEEILDAIRNKYAVRIRYSSDFKDGGTGLRTIQPMAIGTTKKGNPVVRAFQLGGDTNSKKTAWKFFLLSNIDSWRPLKNKHFNTPPNEIFGKYNEFGDNSMEFFMDNAKFKQFDTEGDKEIARLKDQMNAPKMKKGATNGQIPLAQQRKMNVYTSQPNSQKYKDIARNIEISANDGVDRWAAWDLMQKELENQEKLKQVPTPTTNKIEPITNDNDFEIEDNYYDEDEFKVDNNRKR